MKVFVVNLEKNIARMDFMHEQLCRLKVDYERIPAVYGKSLSAQDRSIMFSAFKSFLAMGVRLTDGEIGCALSHIAIYRRMISECMHMAIVLEDDVVLSDLFPRQILKASVLIDQTRPQVVMFSASNDTCKMEESESDMQRVSRVSCTDAYLITLPAAEIILKANYPVVTVADCWMRWAKRFGLELYRMCPPSAMQDNATFGTDVSGWTDPNRKIIGNGTGRSGLDLVAFRFRRVFEKGIDWMLWKLGL